MGSGSGSAVPCPSLVTSCPLLVSVSPATAPPAMPFPNHLFVCLIRASCPLHVRFMSASCSYPFLCVVWSLYGILYLHSPYPFPFLSFYLILPFPILPLPYLLPLSSPSFTPPYLSSSFLSSLYFFPSRYPLCCNPVLRHIFRPRHRCVTALTSRLASCVTIPSCSAAAASLIRHHSTA